MAWIDAANVKMSNIDIPMLEIERGSWIMAHELNQLNDIHVVLGFASKAKLGMEMKSGYFNYNQREMIATWPFILPAYTDTRERNERE